MDKKYIKTSDIEMASTLFTLGIPIDGIYASNNINPAGEPIMEFYFIEDEKTLETIKAYRQRELLVEPSLLLFNRKEILSRMKNQQRDEKNS